MKLPTDYSFGVIPIRLSPTREYLITKHAAGHWGFPKGHPEENESEKETAARELLEETGLEIDHWLDIPSSSINYQATYRDGRIYDKTVTFFPAIVHGTAEAYPPETIDVFWGDSKTVLELSTHNNEKGILLNIERHLNTCRK